MTFFKDERGSGEIWVILSILIGISVTAYLLKKYQETDTRFEKSCDILTKINDFIEE